MPLRKVLHRYLDCVQLILGIRLLNEAIRNMGRCGKRAPELHLVIVELRNRAHCLVNEKVKSYYVMKILE